MSQNVSNSVRRKPPRRPKIRHFLGLFAILGVLASCLLIGIFWWQEGPLREAADLLNRNEPAQALLAVDGFLRDHPLHGKAMSLRARTLVALGQPAEAIRLFERVGTSNMQELHAWSQALLQLERWREALPVLEHLRGHGVDESDVLHELAACRAKVGDLDGAIAAATEFAGQPDCAARGNLLLGTLHNKRGNLRQAAAAWGDVLKLVPDGEGLQVPPAEFFLEYAQVLQLSGNSNMAVDLVDRSLSLQPQATGFVVLGDAQSSLGNPTAATTAYKEALKLSPDLPSACIGLAQLALAEGDASAAMEWLSALQSPETLTSQVAFLLQQATTRMGDVQAATLWREQADQLRQLENARETALQVLRDVPESHWAQVIRAYQFAESGNWSEAELILEPITGSAEEQPFIQALKESVRKRSDLPSLTLLPLKNH